MPKLNPYYIPKEIFPKVEEVRYLNEQTPPKITFAYSQLPQGANVSYFFPKEPRNLTLEQQRIQELIEAAYRGEAEALSEIASYGPGFEDWLKFGAKLTIGAAASVVLGPVPALLIGAGVGGGAKVISECAEDEDTKKVFNFIADCGSGVASGGIAGAGVIPSVIAGGTGLALHGIKQGVEDEDAKRALNFVAGCGTDAGIGGISAGFVKGTRLINPNIDIGQRFAEAITGEMNIGGTIGTEVVSSSTAYFTHNVFHESHKEEGISYDPNCPVCNS